MEEYVYEFVSGPAWLFDNADNDCVVVVLKMCSGVFYYHHDDISNEDIGDKYGPGCIVSRRKIERIDYLVVRDEVGRPYRIKSHFVFGDAKKPDDKSLFVNSVMNDDQLYKTLSLSEKVIYEHALNAAYSFITKES